MTQANDAPKPRALLSGLLVQALQYLSASAVGAVMLYLTVAVLTRLLSPEAYGVFALFQAVATFVAAVASLNFQGAANRFYLEDTAGEAGSPPNEFPSFLRTISTFLLGSNLALVALAWLLADRAGRWLSVEGIFLFAAVVVGVARVPWLLMWKVLTAQLRSRRYSALSVARDTGVFVATAAGAWALLSRGLALEGAVLGATFAALVVTVATTIWVMRQSRGGRLERRHLRYAIVFGVPLIPSTFASTALNLLDRLVIQRDLGLQKTAVYTFAYNIGMVMSVAVVAIVVAATPVFTRLLDAGDHESIEVMWRRFGAGLLALAIGLVLFAQEAAFFLGDERYTTGLFIVPWVVLGYLARAHVGLYALYAVYEKKTWLYAAGNVAAAILNGALNLWLVPRYGFAAAAWTTFGSFLFLLGWQYAVTRLALGHAGPRLRAWLPGLVAASATLPFLPRVLLAIEPYPLRLAVKLVVGAGVAAVGLMKLRGVTGGQPR